MEIVVVGVRGFGKVHLRSIRGADVSIVERDQKVITEVREKYQIHRVYSTYEEALSSGAEIIDLTVPHDLHREFAIKAFNSKKHVILEKPIATNMEDAIAIQIAAVKSGLKCNIAEQYHFDPSLNSAIKLIRDGAIGRVINILVRDQRFYDHRGWRTNRKTMGGGALIDGGIHYIHSMLMIGGPYSGITGRSGKGGSTLEGEDSSLAIFDFTSGATGMLFYSWAYHDPPAVPGLEIVGSSGSIYEEVATRSAKDFKDDSRGTAFGDLVMNGRRLNVEKYDIFVREFSEFIACVEKDLPEVVPPSLAIEDLRAALAIYGIKG
jgi:predicted dehydrogenase